MSGKNRERTPSSRNSSAQGQRRKLGEGFPQGRYLRFECLEARRLLSLAPIISEVDPGNKSGIVDTLGNTADWLEIYNPDPTAAANLSGWTISYEKTGGTTSKTWIFPNNVILGPGAFRVIFCDSSDTNTSEEDPLGELNTGFNLSKDGATVQLINNNTPAAVVSSLTYPSLSSDTSYGPGETVTETDLVAAGATASYYAPTSNSLGTNWIQPGFNASSWASGPTGLGYTGVPGFATTLYRANITVGSVATAETVISTPADQISAVSETESDLNFMDTGGGGHFSSSTSSPWYNEAFPGMTVGEGLSNYVLQATGTITITPAQAGYYTFGVSSDDGFSLAISGADFTTLTNATNSTGTNTMAEINPRGPADTLGTTYLAAGSYPVNLVYYQDGGGAELEFYAAYEGTNSAGATSFDANSILVGASTNITSSGGTSTTTTPLAVVSVPTAGSDASQLSAAILTNVQSTVNAAIKTAGSTSLYSRITFSPSAATLASLTSLTLRMQSDSGYIAYLNGVEIASSNAPASPTWNSTALEYLGSPVQATTYQDVNLTPDIALMSPQTVSSVTSSGTTATVTLPNNGFVNGETITIAGAAQSQYDGNFVIANVTTNTFTYTISGSPVSPATGTITAAPTTDVLAIQTLMASSAAIGSITYNGTTATATTTSANDYCTGDQVQIAGATPAQYDGDYTITVTGPTTFTYTMTAAPTSNASGAAMTATPTDQSLLVLPELCQMTSVIGGDHIFSTPSPGAANTLGDVQPDVTFSPVDGFYSAPFQTTLTPDVAGTLVRYTTDNNAPTAAVPAAAETISSITYGGASDLTATVTCANHGFYSGDQVQIAGAAQTQYDGVFTITVLNANTFTYTMTAAPTSNASGTMTAAVVPVGPENSQAVSSISYSGLTATATCPSESFVAGQQIQITGATPSQYDGVFTIASVPSSTTFTYTMSATPGVAASGPCMTASPVQGVNSISYGGSGGLTATASVSGAVGSITYSGTTATATIPSAEDFDFANGQLVQIAGATPAQYDGTFYISSTAILSGAVSSITYSGTTATVTMAAADNFATGQLVQIAGATPAQYDGAFSITVTSSTTFTYTMASTPSSNASGSMTASANTFTYTMASAPSSNASGSMTATAGFSVGQVVQITGATPWEYDGVFTITSVPSATTFTYTMSAAPGVAASGAGMAVGAVSSLTYTGPITISTTTVLQAAMVDAAGNVGAYQTESYIFPAAVAAQPAAPAGFPTVWDGTVNAQDIAADYAMSSVPGYTTAQIVSALSSLPSMSIVTSNANMLGPNGIYSNSENHVLEVPGSVEYFNPLAGTTNWSGLAGISMYGGVGRDTQYLKHGFQISFDQSDGPSYMNENIFGDGYLPDGMVLRQAFNDGWSWGGAATQFIIDQWTRDALTALGTQNTPGIWVQLFVNGQYWGLYNAVAHIDAAYAAYFFGGQKSDYDIYHFSSDGFEVNYGSITPWDDLFNVASYGNVAGTGTASLTALENPTAYNLISQYLNLPSFCDYIITNYYGANWDWDWHNYSVIYSPTLGFVFQDWDGEGMLLNANDTSTTSNITSRYTPGDPTQLFTDLMANPDFRQLFADHVYKDLNTVLTPTNSAAMYQTLANTISTAVLDESARWGNLGELDGTWDEMGTPATWTAQLNLELGTWFPTRTATMFSQFASAVNYYNSQNGDFVTTLPAQYPSFAPPVLSVNGTVENGGTFTLGATLTMAATTGVIYYTTDGSDPRSGSTDFTISSITLSGTTATVTLTGTSTGLVNSEEIYLGGAAQTQYDGEFTIAGVTVNSAAGTTTFTCTVSGSPASPATPLAGQSLIASTPSSGGLGATAIEYTGPITLTQGEVINARVLSGSTWSALNDSTFYVNLAPSIRVTEVMYDPLPATAAEIAAGYVVSDTTDPYRDFQYIEIENIGTQTLPLGGLEISGGIDFTFPQNEGGVSTNPLLTLAPNSYMVVVADLAAFTIRYGAELQAQFGANWQNLIVAGQFSDHHLNDVSDEVELSEPSGGIIEDFTYQNSWYPQTAGGGFALMVQSPTEALSLTDSSSGWQASGTPGGTPGFADPVTLPPSGAIVVNEAMSNPTGVPGDMIEFYNTTSQPINIGGWFVSNNSADLTEYEIAAGTIIAAEGYPGDYYVLTEDYNFGPTATDPGRLIPFVLNPDGDNVYLSSDATIMPAEAIGSITCSGTTATVTMALADGYSSGDKVQIAGASPAQYDGLFAITVTGPTTFTYSMSTSPGGAASGAAMTAAWIPAGVAGGYQVQQAIHSMPPGYAYGLYTKSDGGAQLPISSITLSGTTATVTMETTDTTLQNGNQVDIEGAAQTQYDGSVVIANVTVNSVAGTTTFTYTVLGSPASPATPIAGESLVAAAGSTNFTLLETPEFGTLSVSGTTYSGAANSIPYVSPLVTDEIMYDPTQPTAAEAADGYVDNDFEYLELYNRSSSPVSLGDYYVTGGVSYTPGWIADGLPNEFETLESGATATWSASSVASASYTVYAHLNLYDGDNNLLTDLDSAAQYTVTYDNGAQSATVVIDQDQVPATFSVTSLTYNNTTGLATAAAAGTGLSAGSIVHISGATQTQYDGAFVVQSATSSTFTYTLATGLNLTAATGTVTAGLNDVWISLGTYTISSGPVSVELTRTTGAKPSEWTIAGGMELVAGSQTTVLGAPTFNAYSIQHPTATLAPGAYAVLVSNYAAFEERYNPTGSNNILVLGVYSGHLSNSGDTVDIDQIGNIEPGSVAAANGYLLSYRVDHINYSNTSPWPTEPDGDGPALIRINTADYGNDSSNWQASNLGGTPGQPNIPIETTPPSIPSNLAGQALLSPTAQINLTWTASSDPQSYVAYYVIYRDGSSLGTSTTNSYVDTTISAGTNYTYTVAAVNRDGYQSALSTGIGIGLPSIISNDEPTSTQIAIYFSEPLTASVASTLANYTVSGKTVSGAALGRDNTLVTLTLSSAMTQGSQYTVTMKNLTTVPGNPLPATQTFTFNYEPPTTSVDIGSPGIAGSASYSGGEWTITGGGGDVWEGTDQCHYVYVPATTGSAAIWIVHIASLTGNDGDGGWTKAGIMARASTSTLVADAYTAETSGNDVTFQWTSTTNTAPNNYTDAGTSAPQWMEMTYSSSGVFNSYYSNSTSATPPTTWTQLGTPQTVTMPAGGFDIGLFVTAHNNNATSSAVFDYNNFLSSSLVVAVLDPTPPPPPTNLRAALTANNTQITLNWSPVLGLPSGVDHYNIYRNGALYATSTTTSYTDTGGISSRSQYSYEVAAVNYDGVVGAMSLPVSLSPVGIASISTPTSTSVLVTFTEPVDPTTAQTRANYSVSGATISAVVLQSDGYAVTLTTSALGTASHTLTISNVKTLALSALPTLTSSFTYALPGWTATLYQANVTVASVANAETVISTSTEQTSVTTAAESVLNFLDTGPDPHFANPNPFPGMIIGEGLSNYVLQATGTIQITSAQAGYYTFGVSSDDGFSLTITGADFTALTNATNSSGTNTMAEVNPRSPGDTLGTTYLAAGSYPVNLVYYQDGGGAELEFYSALGSYTSFTTTPPFELVGDTADGGLSLGSAYVAPPFTVSLNPQSTNNPSPALTGTVTDPAASVTVRVNGSYYAATNNADGTWSLPQGDISALGAGSYNVLVAGINTSGIMAFASTVNQLSVGVTTPTATITAPTSPAVSPVNSIAIQFSEPVENFTLQDLQLTFTPAAGGAAASEPLESATLTTTNDQNWTLGNLAGLTAPIGAYSLTLVGLGSTVSDMFGNPLLTNASTTWTLSQTLTSITVQATSGLGASGTESFAATAFDQFGNPMLTQPQFVWSLSGGGSISSTGVFTPVYTTGTETVQATSGSVAGSDLVTLPGPAQWAGASGASWNSANSWTSTTFGTTAEGPGLRSVSGDGVVFNTAGGGGTVNLNGASPSVANLTFNSTASYTIATGGTGGTLQLADGASPATLTVSAGSHTISAPLALGSDVTVVPAAGSQLTLSGGVSGAGESLTVNGQGTVVLGGTNGFSGGTAVSAGTLVLTTSSAIASGTSLTVGAGGTLIFNSTFNAASNVTPATTSSDASTTTAPLLASNEAISTPQSISAGALPTPVTNQGDWSSIAARIAADRAWLGQVARSSDNSDPHPSKAVTIRAVEAVFAQYK